MKRGLITALFLIAAVAFYIFGEILAATGLLFVGVALELVFWVRLFKGVKNREEPQALES